jgi:spermidine synthase
MDRSAPVRAALVSACFFLSGFSGLVNEVVWSRLFVYTIGCSHLSMAIVVSTFMGGLALGSWLGGPWADRSRNPLRLYGWLVGLTGILSGAVAPLLWLLDPALGVVYRLHDGDPGHPLFTALQVLACAGTILAPTTLMGATMPALVRHATTRPGEVGARVGTLYAVNSLGAVAGTAAGGLVLIGGIGLGWTLALAALIDVAVGTFVVLVLSRRATAPAALPVSPAAPVEPPRSRPAASRKEGPAGSAAPSAGVPRAIRIAVIAFGVSGFVDMCLQLAWTRALVHSIGNSTYAFSVIVGIFILGLAAGGWIAGRFADRLRDPITALGCVLVGIAIAAGATIPWLGMLPASLAWDLSHLEGQAAGFSEFMVRGAGSVAFAIFPSTLLMGMTFPLVGRIRSLAEPRVGRAVGTAYAANTLGSILGTAVTGFVLLPALGRTWMVLYLAVALGLVAGIAVLVAAPARRRAARMSILGGLTAVLLLSAYATRPYGIVEETEEPRLPWHPVIYARGAYYNLNLAGRFPSAEDYARSMIEIWKPLYYRDGAGSSVAVLEGRLRKAWTLSISGKPEASVEEGFSFDLQTQLLVGHIPLIAHPAPRQVLVLGLGSGMTLGSMTLNPDVERIDLLELSPEVLETGRTYFRGVNRDALSNPKVNVILGDGRNHLTHTARKYDVIGSEPSNFWIAGLGNLFTREFYDAVRSRLNPGGVFCQWVYGYRIRVDAYKIALRTFLDAFPHVTIWSNSMSDTFLLGSDEPIAIDLDRMARLLDRKDIAAELWAIGITAPEDLFRYWRADGPTLRAWVGEGPVNSDLFPILEFRSPLGLYDPEPGIPLLVADLGGRGPPPGLARGAAVDPAKIGAHWALGVSASRFFFNLHVGKADAVLEEYRRLAEAKDSWSIEYAGRRLAEQADMRMSWSSVLVKARAIQDAPALALADGFRPGPVQRPEQIEVFRKLAEDGPAGGWEQYFLLAQVEVQAGLTAEGMKSLEVARARKAPPFRVLHLQGIAQNMLGDHAGAEKTLRSAIDSVPPETPAEKAEATYNLGFCIESQGRFEDAAKTYLRAAEMGSDRDRARESIERCLKAAGAGGTR